MRDSLRTRLLVSLTLAFGAVSTSYIVNARPPMTGIDFNWLPHYPELGALVGWFGFVATGVAAAGLVGRLIGLW